MRRALAFFVIFAILIFSNGCGGDSDATSNANDINANIAEEGSDREKASNIAPTGGPGPEPESDSAQPSKNANDSKANDNKAGNNNKAGANKKPK